MRILTLSQLSLAGSSGIAEAKIPLWWADGTVVSSASTSAGVTFLADGNTPDTVATDSQIRLFTLSSTWPIAMKFAFEATIWNTSQTAFAQLYDFTASSVVANTQLSTSSTTATVLRSGQVTLTPSHQYGVTLWTSNGSYPGRICDASLIIFPS